jgi:hypothetical protein
MNQIYGDYTAEQLHKKQEHLTIVFSPGVYSRKERWRNNSLSADFLADYFANFFPGPDSANAETSTRAEVKNAISYIANELLENAVKYNYEPSFHTTLSLHLDANELIFVIDNSVDPEAMPRFHNLIKLLLSADPADLYIQQLENSVLTNSSESGLGLLTMLNDYGARIGWKFEYDEEMPEIIVVTTMVKVSIQEVVR